VVRLHHCLFGHLQHGHGGKWLQQVGEQARVVGCEMHDHHKRQTAVARDLREDFLERRQSAGGGADTHEHDVG
jgi:hypothetical protein